MIIPNGYDLYSVQSKKKDTKMLGWCEHELHIWHVMDVGGNIFTVDVSAVDVIQRYTPGTQLEEALESLAE